MVKDNLLKELMLCITNRMKNTNSSINNFDIKMSINHQGTSVQKITQFILYRTSSARN